MCVCECFFLSYPAPFWWKYEGTRFTDQIEEQKKKTIVKEKGSNPFKHFLLVNLTEHTLVCYVTITNSLAPFFQLIFIALFSFKNKTRQRTSHYLIWCEAESAVWAYILWPVHVRIHNNAFEINKLPFSTRLIRSLERWYSTIYRCAACAAACIFM